MGGISANTLSEPIPPCAAVIAITPLPLCPPFYLMGRLDAIHGCRCRCAAADLPLRGGRFATAWQLMDGFRPLHDGQEGRFRTASLHSPAAR